MDDRWVKKRVLIVVKTYPTPAMSGVEVSCTAGITENKEWIRIFPVPFRLLHEDKRFAKYQWVDVDVTKAVKDFRPESYKLNDQTIQASKLEPSWGSRWKYIAPLLGKSLCEIQATQKSNGSPTLGIFKPAKIKRLIIEKANGDWTQSQLNALNQSTMFPQSRPIERLEKIPFDFKYEFLCSAAGCRGHKLSCTDWEIGQAYRSWQKNIQLVGKRHSESGSRRR